MILDKFSLKGKCGIVTGASQGIGVGIAEALIQAGADVVIAARRMEKLEEVAEELSQYGTKVIPVRTDMLIESDLENLAAETEKAFGRINFLFNNAGIIHRQQSEDVSLEDFDRVINTNLRSLFYLSQLVARIMIRLKTGGTIINTDSLTSFIGGRFIPAYAASKGGVHQITRTLANDWAQYNIRVNSIGPGYIATPNTKPLRDDPVRSKQLLERIPLGRWGTPEDMGGAAVYLASEASAYVTGQTIYVDGGWLAM